MAIREISPRVSNAGSKFVYEPEYDPQADTAAVEDVTSIVKISEELTQRIVENPRLWRIMNPETVVKSAFGYNDNEWVLYACAAGGLESLSQIIVLANETIKICFKQMRQHADTETWLTMLEMVIEKMPEPKMTVKELVAVLDQVEADPEPVNNIFKEAVEGAFNIVANSGSSASNPSSTQEKEMNANDINTAAAETATAATTEAAAQTSAAGAGGAEGVFPKAESVEDAMFSDLKQRAGFTEEKKTKEKNEHTSLFSNNNTYGQTAALMGRTFVFGCAMGAGTVAGTYLATKAIQMLTDRFGNNEAPASE